MAVLAIGAGVWWRLSQRSPDVDAVIAAVQPGDPLGVVLVPLGMGHSAVVEVARDQRLGGKELPPFEHPVDVVFAPNKRSVR